MGYKTAINSFETDAQIQPCLDALSSVATNDIGYMQADLSDAEAAANLVTQTIVQFGRIDVLVNNARVQKVAPLEEFPPQDWNRIRAISLDAAFHTTRAALVDMSKRQLGRILNISSAHGLVVSPYKSAYISAKHGVIGLTKTTALEVVQRGISANAVCPGYVWTPLVGKQLNDQAKTHNMGTKDVINNIMLAPQPTKKFVQIEEVAEMAAFLASDA